MQIAVLPTLIVKAPPQIFGRGGADFIFCSFFSLIRTKLLPYLAVFSENFKYLILRQFIQLIKVSSFHCLRGKEHV